jgi:CheY-like chemotaxis protein
MMPACAKILLVEDHDDIRAVMAKLLSRLGYTVVEASTVAEGIACVDGQAIAVLDLYLPDGLGSEVLAYIRKQNRSTRVAFTTAAFDPAIPISLLAPGDVIFKKPIDFEQLRQWIDQPPAP